MILDGSDNLIDLNYPQQSVVVEDFFIFEECATHLQGLLDDEESLCTLMPTYAQSMHNYD